MQRERVQVGRKPIGRLKGLRQCAGQYRRKSNGNRSRTDLSWDSSRLRSRQSQVSFCLIARARGLVEHECWPKTSS